MLNKTILTGRTCQEIEIRTIGSGDKVANFNLAVERDFKDKSTGEKVTDFIPCVAWKNTAEVLENYVHKGNLLTVEGRIAMESWTDKEGQSRITMKVQVAQVYLLSQGSPQGNSTQTMYGYSQGYQEPAVPQKQVRKAPSTYYPPQEKRISHNQAADPNQLTMMTEDPVTCENMYSDEASLPF